jgi:hypothetical protein
MFGYSSSRSWAARVNRTIRIMGELHMLRRLVAGVVGAVVLTGSLLTLAAAQDAKKDGAKDKKADAKETKEIKGKITKVDVDKMSLSIETEDGKKLDFKVDDDVKFIGPNEGVSKLGIKDDRVKVGAQVTLTTDATGKALKEVHLPRRGAATDKSKDKDKKASDKDK